MCSVVLPGSSRNRVNGCQVEERVSALLGFTRVEPRPQNGVEGRGQHCLLSINGPSGNSFLILGRREGEDAHIRVSPSSPLF